MRTRRLPLRFFVRTELVAILFLFGCAPSASDLGSPAEHPQSIEFTTAFVPLDSVTLLQPDTAQIVRFGGGLVDDAGRILVVDVSEGDLSLYERDGTYRRRIVQRGEGPDQIPQAPVVVLDAEGQLHAGTMGRNVVLVFGGPDYRLIRRVTLDSAKGIVSLARLANGDYLSTEAASLKRHSVMRHDSLGRFVAGYLTLARAPVADQPESPFWNTYLISDIRVRDDTAFVIQSLADSIWRLDLTTGDVTSLPLSFAGYVKPSLPSPDQLKSPRELDAWVKGFHLASQFAPGVGTRHIVQYSSGSLFSGGDVTLRMVGANTVFTGAPPIFAVDSQSVVVVRAAELSDGVIRLVRYRFVDPAYAETAGAMVRELVSASTTLACGEPDSANVRPGILVGFTLAQCMSCDLVGYHMRRIQRVPEVQHLGLGVVVPEQDAADVCQYLRSERVNSPVFTGIVRDSAHYVALASGYFLARRNPVGTGLTVEPYSTIGSIGQVLGVPTN